MDGGWGIKGEVTERGKEDATKQLPIIEIKLCLLYIISLNYIPCLLKLFQWLCGFMEYFFGNNFYSS